MSPGWAPFPDETDGAALADFRGRYGDVSLGPVLVVIATGSRILGGQETRDVVRRAGIHVFARLVSVFTGRRVTDTSFGFRAMRAEVTAAVTLRQPQYQSSELLLGTLLHGFRVAERPMTMRVRAAGETKKGSNLVYGLNYSGVVFGTWLRERFGSRSATTSPAGIGRRAGQPTDAADR